MLFNEEWLGERFEVGVSSFPFCKDSQRPDLAGDECGDTLTVMMTGLAELHLFTPLDIMSFLEDPVSVIDLPLPLSLTITSSPSLSLGLECKAFFPSTAILV